MREPWFWRSPSIAARAVRAAFSPLSLAYRAGQSLRRTLTRPHRASVPVICIGNATLGGAGKTPFAILVARLLIEAGYRPAFLTRGYGGAVVGPVVVDPNRHAAVDVGDEALLLSRRALTILSRNRPLGAALAAQQGADVIIMDDGFQNPSLAKDLSILLSDGTDGAVFPAGPMREPLRVARSRADLVVNTGGAGDADFTARTEIAGGPAPQRVIAFAGIGRPEKFFATLRTAGFDVARCISFPDHHAFTDAELSRLRREAAREKAVLITTEKDLVRIGSERADAIHALPVVTAIDAADVLRTRLTALFERNAGAQALQTPKPSSAVKRRVTLLHRLELAAVLALTSVFRLLGVDAASFIAGKTMRFAGPLLRPVSRKAERGYTLIFPEWSISERKRVMRDLWENLGRTAAEFIHMPEICAPASGRVIIDGWERLDAVRASGKPAVLFSGHFANWEVIPAALHQAGLDYISVYRAANNPLTDAFILSRRAKVISPFMVPKGKQGGRALVDALKAGRSIAMFVDQKLNAGIEVPFMGRPAMTAPAAARLALKYDAPLIQVSLERLKGAHFRMTVHPPLEFAATGDATADVEALTIRINEALEKDIRARPAQWLWFHRRWPKSLY